jgi:hypothetical protein
MTSHINYKFEEFDPFPNRDLVTTINHTRIGNFLKHNTTKNNGGNNRFRASQVLESFVWFEDFNPKILPKSKVFPIDSLEAEHYIIPVGVADSPEDWTGQGDKWAHSIFELIDPVYLQDLQHGKALLLIDQTLEGYHKSWLWSWFHDECDKHNIDPSAVIYSTGCQSAIDHYDAWYIQNNVTGNRIKVVPSIALSMHVFLYYKRKYLDTNFQNILDYKQKHYTDIALYDCINFKFRKQRVLNFLHLFNSGLVEDGLISMGDSKEWPLINPAELSKYKLPLDIVSQVTASNVTPVWADGDPKKDNYGDLIPRIIKNVHLNSWVSLITESAYFKEEHSVFISEKTFKPIACMQPFIMVGAKDSLKYLRKIGYKTFDGFIDESYDDLEDAERFIAIMESLKKIQQIDDKLSWLKSMQDILEHNHRVFLSIGSSRSIENQTIIDYYNNYFKV